MNCLRFLKVSLSTVLLFMLSLTLGYANNGVKMELTTNKVVNDDQGKVVYIPVRTAPVGTIIQYKATYTNTLAKDINDLIITLPIPSSMTFTGEAHPASAQASTDGKNFADIPLVHQIAGKMTNTPFSEYRYIRWSIKLLPAKKSASVSLNTTVN